MDDQKVMERAAKLDEWIKVMASFHDGLEPEHRETVAAFLEAPSEDHPETVPLRFA